MLQNLSVKFRFGFMLWEIKERKEIFQSIVGSCCYFLGGYVFSIKDEPFELVQYLKKTNSLPKGSQDCPVCPEMYSSLMRNCCKTLPNERSSAAGEYHETFSDKFCNNNFQRQDVF